MENCFNPYFELKMNKTRSVKNLNLAALKVREDTAFLQGCKIEIFNGSIFLFI